MQKTILSKALSLSLTLMLCLGIFATVQTASTTAWAETITDGSGNQYEVSFATNGTTATQNGITATIDFEVDLNGDGWGWNPETQKSEQGARVSFPVQFTGNADAGGLLTVIINGTKKSGGIFEDSIDIYVKEGKPIENNLGEGNTLFLHLSMKAIEAFGGLTDIKVTLDFEPMDNIYQLNLSSFSDIGQNGVVFELAVGQGDVSTYWAAGELVGVDLWAWGTPLRAGIYTINVSSEKAGIKATRTLDVNAKVGKYIDENLMEDRNIEHETYFMMPAHDVDDFVFTVSFSPSGGGSSSSKSSSKSGSGGGGNSTLSSSPTPAPVNAATAVQSVKDAVMAAKNSPNGAAVNLKNPTTVSLNTLREMAKAAGNTPLKLNADSLNADGSVDVRITFDPKLATKNVNLSASTESPQAINVKNKFQANFNNNVSVVSLNQKGSFDMPVRIAAKIDSKLNKDSLVFYVYDSATNSYKQIPDTNYRVDKNGYVHFTTSVAGDIVISDKPLAKK